jgi:hypothetical protein
MPRDLISPHLDKFFEVSKMNLQQDLDEFQYHHAPETLYAGTFGEDHLNPRAHTGRKLQYICFHDVTAFLRKVRSNGTNTPEGKRI